MSLADFHPVYLAIEEYGDIVVAAFTVSQLSDDQNIDQLGHELFALVDQYGCRRFVLSLAKVEYITSAVLGKIITLHRKLHRYKGSLVLCGVSEPVNSVFMIANLIDYFDIAEDVEDAIATLS